MDERLKREVRDRAGNRCEYCRIHQDVRLYHPRTDLWDDHFDLEESWIVGRTAIGRATVELLAVNQPDALQLRKALLAQGLFP